jgi:hypothetical protein
MRRRMAGRSLSSVIDFGVLICPGSHAGLQLACECSLIKKIMFMYTLIYRERMYGLYSAQDLGYLIDLFVTSTSLHACMTSTISSYHKQYNTTQFAI